LEPPVYRTIESRSESTNHAENQIRLGRPLSYLNSVKCNFSRAVDIDRSLTRFWKVEKVKDSKVLSNEEKQCKKHFLKNAYRNEDGRFVMSILSKGILVSLMNQRQCSKTFN